MNEKTKKKLLSGILPIPLAKIEREADLPRNTLGVMKHVPEPKRSLSIEQEKRVFAYLKKVKTEIETILKSWNT